MSDNRRVKVYRDAVGEWRFTYWASSDRVATSNDGYKNKAHALDMVEELYPGVPVEVLEAEGEGA